MAPEKLKLATKSITNRSEVLVLLLAVFTVSAFIELSYGSKYLGIIAFGLGVFVLYLMIKRVKTRETGHTPSTISILSGLVLISADISYNYLKGYEIQTFDSMIILLGLSLMMYGSGTWLVEIGRFSMYFTSIFLILFITLFLIPMRINMDLPYYYGQYAVTMPVVFLLNTIGLNVKIPENRLIEVLGNYHALLKIDLACFGWYSILLIVSMLVAYNLTIERRSWGMIAKIMSILIGASYLANLLRVSALVVLTYYYGVETMLSIHSHLGWILFVVILLPITYIFMKNSSPKKE